MSGGKKNPAVLFHKLGGTGTSVSGVVKTYRECTGKELVFDMIERCLMINDTDGETVIVSPKELEACYFQAKSMGWMNDD